MYLRFLASSFPPCAPVSLPRACVCPSPLVHESLPSFRASIPSLLHRALPILSRVLYCLSRSSLPPSSSPAMHPVLFSFRVCSPFFPASSPFPLACPVQYFPCQHPLTAAASHSLVPDLFQNCCCGGSVRRGSLPYVFTFWCRRSSGGRGRTSTTRMLLGCV